MDNLCNNTTLERNTTNNSSEFLVTQSGNPLPTAIALSVAYVAAISFGSLGNSLVIVSIIINRNMRSTTNLFIASLAAADLIVTSTCMPLFFVYNVLTWPLWPFGSAGCRIASFLVHMSVMASALSLLSISYDRFLSVFLPMKRLITLPRAKKIVAFIWFVSPFLLLPSLLHHDTVAAVVDGKQALQCVESWNTVDELHSYQMYRISCYFLFLLQISVVYFLIGHRLYTRQQPGEQTSQSKAKELMNKRKIIKMLFLVVALFALCWLPYIVNKLLNIFPPKPDYIPPNLFVFVGNFLGLLNSVANPVVYAVLNKNFRTAFKNALKCNCNYELEERRRTVSVVSKPTQRRQSESVSAERRRASSLSASENPVFTMANKAGGNGERPRGLSFSSIKQEPIVELSEFSICPPQTRRNSENRRVCFTNDLFNSEEDDSQTADNLENRTQNLNQGVEQDSDGIPTGRRQENHLSPIEEKAYSNASFQEENERF